jgi:hypothetical protein
MKGLLLFFLMLIGLSACGEFFRSKQAPHSWEGDITFLLTPFITSAYAEDSICLSTCTSEKCAHLVVHTNSTTSERVCSTNADTKYKFEFSEDPNAYYHGKMVEIIIEDSSDELNNRVYVEVVDKDNSINIKDIGIVETILSKAIKGQVLVKMDDQLNSLRSYYENAVAQLTLDSLNSAIGYLSGEDLLTTNATDDELRKALRLTNKLEPTFLGEMVSMVQESEVEETAFSGLQELYNNQHTVLSSSPQENLTGNLTACYLLKSSLETGSYVPWSPLAQLGGNCTFNSGTGQATCQVIIAEDAPPLYLISDLPTEPTDASLYIKASEYLNSHFNNNGCLTNAYRSGGYIAIDNTLKTINGIPFNNMEDAPKFFPDEESPPQYQAIDPNHNSFLYLKVYSKCLNDPNAFPYCSVFSQNDDVASLQTNLVQNGFCYY